MSSPVVTRVSLADSRFLPSSACSSALLFSAPFSQQRLDCPPRGPLPKREALSPAAAALADWSSLREEPLPDDSESGADDEVNSAEARVAAPAAASSARSSRESCFFIMVSSSCFAFAAVRVGRERNARARERTVSRGRGSGVGRRFLFPLRSPSLSRHSSLFSQSPPSPPPPAVPPPSQAKCALPLLSAAPPRCPRARAASPPPRPPLPAASPSR